MWLNSGSLEPRAITAMWEVVQNKCLLHLPSSFAVGYGQVRKFWLVGSKQKYHVAASGKFPYETTCVKSLLFFNLNTLVVDVATWTIGVMLSRMMRNREIEFLLLWTTYSDIYLREALNSILFMPLPPPISSTVIISFNQT